MLVQYNALRESLVAVPLLTTSLNFIGGAGVYRVDISMLDTAIVRSH